MECPEPESVRVFYQFFFFPQNLPKVHMVGLEWRVDGWVDVTSTDHWHMDLWTWGICVSLGLGTHWEGCKEFTIQDVSSSMQAPVSSRR